MTTIFNMMSLENKVVAITGGAGHIGSVMAQAVAEVGAKVVLVDINKSSCQSKAKTLKSEFGNDTLALHADLSKSKQVKNIPSKVLEKFGKMDVLINCAAFTGDSKLKGWAVPFEDQSIESWRKSMDVNLTSIFELIQACQKALNKSKNGSIINISSIYGIVGPDLSLYSGTKMGNPAAYAAAKGGLIQLTRWLASSLAPKVRVNSISLGGVFRGQNKKFVNRYSQRTPLKRMAKEEDVKGAAVYLASDLSKYVTGHNLVIDGGWTIW